MSKISKEKEAKIMSDILAVLYNNSPKALFTADISRAIARDEEFVKRLLIELGKKGMIASIDKNPQGIKYSKRQRWRISSKIYDTYKKLQQKGIEAY